MSEGLVLHGSPHSLPTYRVALMLRLCGAGFRFRYVSFQRRMHLAPAFRALSRWGQVPALELSGRNLDKWPGVAAWAGRIEALAGFAAPFDLLAMQDAEIAAAS